jgi:membrane-bound lytic murein transglycosylase D
MFRAFSASALVFALFFAASAAAGPLVEIAYQAQQGVTPAVAAFDASKPARLEQLVPLPEVAALAVPPPVKAPDEAVFADVWDRLRKSFGMPELTGPLVERQQAYFMKRQDILKGIVQRSRKYLYHVVSELERRKMPTELALLPMIESGYNPLALSSAQASGLWQFIPKTAKRYELPQTATYDARRDVLASTRAALDYLEFLYGLLGDWHLALASYNWGEESVMAAQERNRAKGRPATFDALVVPEETRLYVPKLQALKNIIANPDAFGITLDPLPNEPYFATITNTHSLDLRTAAKLAEIPLDEFLALNPAFNGATVSATEVQTLLLPADRVEKFRQNLDSLRPAAPARNRAGGARSVASNARGVLPPGQN